jgi:hypothetical protein
VITYQRLEEPMALAAEDNRSAAVNDVARSNRPTPGNASLILRTFIALTFMAGAANCFLKYLWWAACYSAWSGIPKLAAQWRRAGIRASFFGWSVLVLELVSIALVFSLIRGRKTGRSSLLKNGFLLAVSLLLTIASSALIAGALSWLKQGTQ